MNNITGEILYVNVKSRSAMVYDEDHDKFIEIPLLPKGRDDDLRLNTSEYIPKEGTKVLLQYSNGEAKILGPAPILSEYRDINNKKIQRKLTNVSTGDPLLYGIITDELSTQDGYSETNCDLVGSNDPIYKKTEGNTNNFSGTSFPDVLPGDHIFTTKDGNALGVLEGGVTYFKASELCQIIGIKYNDLMRIVSRNFEQFTDFGNISIKNDNGATSYVIEGAASQSEVRDNRFTFRMEMGSAGDLYKVSVLDGQSREVSMFHMKSDGEIFSLMQNQKTIIRKNKTEIIHGTVECHFQGAVNSDYKSDYVKIIHGSEQRQISNNKTIGIKNDHTVSIGRNSSNNIGGTKLENILGSIPLSNAVEQNISVGTKNETITTTGDFKRTIKVKGNFIRSTTAGDVSDETLLGDLLRSTAKGDFKDTTIIGNHLRETLNGNIVDACTLGNHETEVNGGDLKIKVNKLPSGGNILIESGIPGLYNTIVMNDSGIEITDKNLGTVVMSSSGIKLKEVTGGTLNLSLGKVALGNPAIELLNLVDQILVQLNNTELGIASHIHGSAVGPTSPPMNASVFVQAQAQLMAIKAQLAIITGST
jgi:hypothetical protein